MHAFDVSLGPELVAIAESPGKSFSAILRQFPAIFSITTNGLVLSNVSFKFYHLHLSLVMSMVRKIARHFCAIKRG